MIGMVTIANLLGRVPRPVWYIVAAIAVLLLVARWHHSRVDAAYTAGGAAQASVDRAAVAKAAFAANAAQQALRTSLAARQEKVSKGTDHALLAQNADLARRYDDLRLRWAAYRTDQRGAGDGRAIAVPRPAGIVDGPDCPAAGWVSFDTAAAAAQAADEAIARDDAWRAWVVAQAAAWPKG
jgi:hypothetical protein